MSTEIVPHADDPEDEAPFLETAPPHWAARGLAYMMILLFFAAVVVSIFLHLPETVSSPFTLVPVRGTDAVRTLRSGVVLEAPASEGQSVTKGATIFVIRSRDVGERFSELETLESQLRNNVESLANSRRKYQSVVPGSRHFAGRAPKIRSRQVIGVIIGLSIIWLSFMAVRTMRTTSPKG